MITACQKRDFIGRTSNFSALKNINLSLKENSALGLVGESGSGKSSLARSILGIEKFSGEIFFKDKNILNYNNKEKKIFKKNCQLVFQDPFSSLSPRQKIFDIVKEGLDIHESSLNTLQKKEKVLNVLEDVKMDESCLTKFPHEFSGGQRQRIALAKVLILEPEFLILDEPTSSLDAAVQKQIIKLLVDLQKDLNLSYLFISHDLELVSTISHRMVVMKDGMIVDEGTPARLLRYSKNEYTKRLVESSIF